MKVIILISLLLCLTGCADVKSSSNNTVNNETGIDNNTNNTDNNQEKNILKTGVNNIEIYDNAKMLHTLVYYMPEKISDDYSKKAYYNISGNNQTLQNKEDIVYKAKNIVLNPKERMNEHIKNIQDYAEKHNIKPIYPNADIKMKTMPEIINKGTKWNNVYLLVNNSFKLINAECIAVSDYAYFFIQEGLTITQEQIDIITAAFDRDYIIVHQLYDVENDIDNNGKVSFLIADFDDGLMGYFYTPDKYADGTFSNAKSNEADVLYINHKYFEKNRWEKNIEDVKATFIHEFQHMVLFDSRVRNKLNTNISVWLNEGLSMLAEYYGGYTLPHKRYISNFFSSSQGKSLITNDSTQNYGLSLLFARYLQERFGDEYIKKIYKSKETGVKAVEEAVSMDFNILFNDFIKMLLITGRNITDDKRYNILSFNYIQGSEEYNKNGFNLAELIDEVYSENSGKNSFITSAGYKNKELEIYSFFLTKWNGTFNQIELQGNNGIGGIYYIW